MRPLTRPAFWLLLSAGIINAALAPLGRAASPANCQKFNLDGTASVPSQAVSLPPAHPCNTRMSNGFPLPDPACTPGAVNPTLTVDVLRNPEFRTGCVRSHATTEEEKAITYEWYGIDHPAHNSGVTQTCELDHLIPLELGGADTLDNIWPQCGPDGVILAERYFELKDTVENYLAKQMKEGRMDLGTVQKSIATDWTQYLADAQRACPGGRCR
jgi:hypothetical protein